MIVTTFRSSKTIFLIAEMVRILFFMYITGNPLIFIVRKDLKKNTINSQQQQKKKKDLPTYSF